MDSTVLIRAIVRQTTVLLAQRALSWVIPLIALAGCSPSASGGGSESNFVACKSTSDCPVGLVCSTNRCERGEAGATASGGGSSGNDSSAGGSSAGRTGAGGMAGSGGDRHDAGSDASVDGNATSTRDRAVHADAQQDARVDADASPAEACFDVAPAACGALAVWSPSPSANGWSVLRATAIEGSGGFVVLMFHGPPAAPDSYAFATVGADGGCAKLVGPPAPWPGIAPLIGRAVSRGGTLAFIATCGTAHNPCVKLLLNGAEWAEPAGGVIGFDVDVASDGRALVVSLFSGDSALSTDAIVRWVSPIGEILAEHRFRDFAVRDTEIFDDGTIALAATRADSTSVVQFLSGALDPNATWDAGPSRVVTAIGGHFPLLGVAGTVANSNAWTGVIDVRTHGTTWSRTWSSPQQALALEIDAQGAIDTLLWSPLAFTVSLLLHDTKDAAGVIAAPIDGGLPHSVSRFLQIGSMQKEPGGRILFSTDFAGTYCEKD